MPHTQTTPNPTPEAFPIFEAVTEFHRTFGLAVADTPTTGDRRLQELRRRLIEEEFVELVEAMAANHLAEMADAIADLIYVAYGAAVSFGFPIDEILAEVHRSNMTKLWSDEDSKAAVEDPDHPASRRRPTPGGFIVYRADGKILKPATFSEPRIREILESHIPTATEQTDGTVSTHE